MSVLVPGSHLTVNSLPPRDGFWWCDGFWPCMGSTGQKRREGMVGGFQSEGRQWGLWKSPQELPGNPRGGRSFLIFRGHLEAEAAWLWTTPWWTFP